MPIHDDALAFAHHLACYRSMGVLREGGASEGYWRDRAATMQFHSVQTALRDLFFETVALSGRFPEGAASHQLRYGAGRRLKIVLHSVVDLHAVAPPGRHQPMNQDEVDTAARALNDFYIHTLGLLDNYAHAIGSHLAGARFDELRPAKRTLFCQAFLDRCDSPTLRSLVEPFRTWANTVKLLRNPVAHGIPLTVPRAAITNETRADHQAAWDAYQAALSSPPPTDGPDSVDAVTRWVTRVKELENRVDAIGEFQPWIAHDPRAGVVPIYPTVLEDASHLIRICRAMNSLLADPERGTGDVPTR